MTISLPTAKRLCTSREYALVLSSRPRAVRTLSDREVRAQVVRARKARDTFRERARSQRREQRGKVRPRGGRRADGNQRTVEKEKLFTEVLAAFTAELSRRKAAEQVNQEKAGRTTVKAKVGKAKVGKAKAVKRRAVKTPAKKMKAGKAQAKPRSVARSATTRSAAPAKAPTKRGAKTAAKTKTTNAKRKTPAPKARATVKKRARTPAPTETTARAMLPPSPVQVAPDKADDHGMAGNRAAVHQPIPAITRRGRSLLATDISGKQSMKRIPRAQRRARYGSVSALGRRNQARRDSRS